MATASKRVDDFKDSIFEVSQRDGKTTWPIDLNSVIHLFAGDFDQALIDDIAALQQLGLSRQEIGRLFVIPQRIIRLVMPFVQGMGALGLSRQQRSEKVDFLLSLADSIKYGDPSNRDGKNILLSPEESRALIGDSRQSESSTADSRLVHMTCGILWAYVETLFFKTHGFVREFHGPYQQSDNDAQYLVRDFACLKPLEIWPQCENLRYSNARIVTAYDGLDFSVDIYNHVAIPAGRSFAQSLQSYYVECDGEILNRQEMEQLCRDLSEVLGNVNTSIEAMDWRSRAQKYAEIFWYSKKGLSDRLGQDWAPPPAVLKKINDGELKAARGTMSDKELRILLKLSF